MLTIQATDAGFHTLSPLDAEMAPNVFLRTRVNIEGTIIFEPETGVWVSAESLRYAGLDIEMNVSTLANAKGGSDIVVTGISYIRYVDGEKVNIGAMEITGGLLLDQYLDNPGGGNTYVAHADAADALEALIRKEGFMFAGGEGNDIFHAHADIYPIYGRVALRGNGGDDYLHGSVANDSIHGGDGNDILIDNYGHNKLRGGHGDDYLELGVWSKNSKALGGNGNDVLISSNGSDILKGGRGEDRLEGNRGNDILIGSLGDDELFGGEGKDRLRGGTGDDYLSGGADADKFIFEIKNNGHDTLSDFDGSEDFIFLKHLSGGYDALTFTDVGVDVVMNWTGEDQSVLIADHNAVDLSEDMFIF